MRRNISASQFKARCFGPMDQMVQDGDVLVITRNDRPFAELYPCSRARPVSPFGLHPDLELRGDVVSPLGESWEALR